MIGKETPFKNNFEKYIQIINVKIMTKIDLILLYLFVTVMFN